MRMFTAQALEFSELLIITLGDLLKMKLEFYEIFAEIFNEQTQDKLRMQLLHKLEAIKMIEEQEVQKANGNVSQDSHSKFRYHIIETIQRLMSSNRQIPKKLEAQLMKVLQEEQAKGEKEGLIQKRENGVSQAIPENPFDPKGSELAPKYIQRQAVTSRGDGGDSSDVNLKGLMQPSTIRGHDSDSQVYDDQFLKHDDNTSVALDEYKYRRSRIYSSNSFNEEDDISYAEHLSYSLHDGQNLLRKEKSRQGSRSPASPQNNLGGLQSPVQINLQRRPSQVIPTPRE